MKISTFSASQSQAVISLYSKVGFQQISEEVVKAPLELTQPEGWLAQSLRDGVIDAMAGSSRCVSALDKQEYW